MSFHKLIGEVQANRTQQFKRACLKRLKEREDLLAQGGQIFRPGSKWS